MPADTSASAASAEPTTPSNDPNREIGEAERSSGLRTIRKVAPYLWPADKPWVKQRVVLAMLALFLSKLVSVYTPILYRDAVNILGGEGVSDLALGAVGLTVAYGVARLMNVGFQQLRDAILCTRGATGVADAGARDVPAHSPPVDALPYHAQNRRAEPHYRKGRQRGRIPFALPSFLNRAADPRIAADRDRADHPVRHLVSGRRGGDHWPLRLVHLCSDRMAREAATRDE